MTLRMKAVTAALALAFAGAANAAIDAGELFLVVDKESASGSFDLGLSLADFLPGAAQASTPGEKIVWNFAANTVTVTPAGVASIYTGALSGSWSTAWSSIKAAAGNPTWGVLAENDGTFEIASTSGSTDAVTLATTDAEIIGAAGSGGPNYVAALNAESGHGAANGGAFVNDAISGALHNNAFGTADKWADNTAFTALNSGNTSNFFYLPFDGANGKYQGTFTFDLAGNTLTYETAPPVVGEVPEPSTYALLLSGAALFGFIARRRLA